MAAATVGLVLAVSSPAAAQEEGQEAPAAGDGAMGYGAYGYPEPPPHPDDPGACQYEPEGCEGPPQYFAPHLPQPEGEPESAPIFGGDDAADVDDLGSGSAPVEVVGGDPDDAAALTGAIEAARADRAGGVHTATAAEPTGEEAAAVEGGVPGEGTATNVVADAEGGVLEDQTVDGETTAGQAASGQSISGQAAAGQAATGNEADVGEGAPEARDSGDGIAVPDGDAGGGVAVGGGPGTSDVPPPAVLLLGAGSVLVAGAGLLLRRFVR